MNTVTRTCDECGHRYEIREDIAADEDAWAAQGEPYVCTPSDPYADDELTEYEKSGELEDAFDERTERFPGGKDVVSIECSNCHESTNVPNGEMLLCSCGQILNNAGRAAKGFVKILGADYYQRSLNAGMTPVIAFLDDSEIDMLQEFAKGNKGKWEYYAYLDEVHSVLETLSWIVESKEFKTERQRKKTYKD